MGTREKEIAQAVVNLSGSVNIAQRHGISMLAVFKPDEGDFAQFFACLPTPVDAVQLGVGICGLMVRHLPLGESQRIFVHKLNVALASAIVDSGGEGALGEVVGEVVSGASALIGKAGVLNVPLICVVHDASENRNRVDVACDDRDAMVGMVASLLAAAVVNEPPEEAKRFVADVVRQAMGAEYES